LQSYFELGEFPALASLLDSFTTFIQRQTKLGYHRERYLNLIKYTKKLMKIGRLKTPGRRLLLQQFLAERSWLVGKVG